MNPPIQWVLNRMPRSVDRHLEAMSLQNVAKAQAFHRSFPQYAVTPLAKLPGMADYLGLGAPASVSMPLRCWAAPSPWAAASPRSWAGTCPR